MFNHLVKDFFKARFPTGLARLLFAVLMSCVALPSAVSANTYNEISKTQNNAIFITHGWNSSVNSWPVTMAWNICNRIGNLPTTYNPAPDNFTRVCNGNGWDIWLVDWRTQANTGVFNPVLAFNNAAAAGRHTATRIAPLNYTHVHLVAHSAGANLVSSIATHLKRLSLEQDTVEKPFVHATFFDAYDPGSIDLWGSSLDFSRLGNDADAIEHYLDSRMLEGGLQLSNLDRTQNIIKDALNIELSNADPTEAPVQQSGSFSFFDLGFVLAEQFSSQHDWPFKFYNQTINDGSLPLGFQLSPAALETPALLTRSTKFCTVNNITQDCSPVASRSLTLYSTTGTGNQLLGEIIELDTIDASAFGNTETLQAYVFSRTDINELRWIDTGNDGVQGSVIIDQTCADSLGGPIVVGNGFDLIAQAPAQDSIDNPCTSIANPTTLPAGYIFSRTDVDELRWISINSDGVQGSIWIDQACADSLGGATVFGNWFELSVQAPAQDSVPNPCTSPGINSSTTELDPNGYVFSRTDVNELRWIATNSEGVTGSVWIDERCAESLGGPSVFGNWVELTVLAPAQDSITAPCR